MIKNCRLTHEYVGGENMELFMFCAHASVVFMCLYLRKEHKLGVVVHDVPARVHVHAGVQYMISCESNDKRPSEGSIYRPRWRCLCLTTIRTQD